MAEPTTAGRPPEPPEAIGGGGYGGGGPTRKEKRKDLKKLKRRQLRRDAAIKEREEEAARANDPEEQLRIQLREQEEAEIAERERRTFEERERLWLEAAAARKAVEEEEEEEAARKKLQEDLDEETNKQKEHGKVLEEDEGDEWDYVEDGPAEIIWQGNEIIVKKKKVRVAKRFGDLQQIKEDDDRPTSNPLPPQSEAYASYKSGPSISAQEVLERVSQQVPNFGTEQDKAHCPFHLKTGACRFGSRCSRVHFHPDKSCTLLIKNMYNGPGLAWEQDEGLEYTDEEVERSYEEFYEDVHTEFLKFGELVNFKVCRNGSSHLRGNVYVHYKSLESALLAYYNINGRYFAGKQISIEFVGITKWKAAICGEYMKSRLKTCSHGTACNFIHCFRNPGGDYEWADWDNPPPKYWIKKMAALFGPSDESGYDKQMELEDRERPTDRKRTPHKSRYHSRRSSCEMDEQNGGSARKSSDLHRDSDHHHSIRKEHSSRRRREAASLNKYEHAEANCMSDVNYDLHGQDSDKYRSKERDSGYPEKQWKYGEKDSFDSHYQNKGKYKVKKDLIRPKREKTHSNEQSKSERKYRSKADEQLEEKHGSSCWHSDYANDNRELSDSRLNRKSSVRPNIDEKRYDGKYRSDDFSYDRDSSARRLLQVNQQSEGKQDDRYVFRHHASHRSHDYDSDEESSKLRKKKSGFLRDSSDDSTDGQIDMKKVSCSEDTHDGLPCNKSSQSIRKHSRSSRKRKHRREKSECRDIEEEFSSSDSDSQKRTRGAYKKHSRSCTPI